MSKLKETTSCIGCGEEPHPTTWRECVMCGGHRSVAELCAHAKRLQLEELRDRLAGQAMQTMLDASLKLTGREFERLFGCYDLPSTKKMYEANALQAYLQADAMIAMRNEPPLDSLPEEEKDDA